MFGQSALIPRSPILPPSTPFDPSTGSGLRTGFDRLRVQGSPIQSPLRPPSTPFDKLRTGFGGAQGSGQASAGLTLRRGSGLRTGLSPLWERDLG